VCCGKERQRALSCCGKLLTVWQAGKLLCATEQVPLLEQRTILSTDFPTVSGQWALQSNGSLLERGRLTHY
jgi:hypothetical protein